MAETEKKLSQNNAKKKYIIAGISMLLACIYISLVVSLEAWSVEEQKPALLTLWITGLPLAAVLNWFFAERWDKRLRAHSLVCGLLMSLAYVCGCRLRRDGTVLAGIGKLPVFMVQVLFLAVFAAVCVAPLIGRAFFLHSRKAYAGGIYRFVFYGLVILASWLPVYLAYYPSVFAYDAEGQLYQVIAHDYSTHHPLLHTLFLGAFFKLGGALESYSLGMAIHSVVQMLLMAGIFAYTLMFLYRRNIPVVLRVLLLAFYSLFPVNSILALSTTKDVLFSGLALLYMLHLWEALVEEKKECAGLIVVTALLLLFRNNAVYALIAAMPFGWFLIHKRKGLAGKKYIIVTLVSFAVFAAAYMGLKMVTGAVNGSPREMLSIPLQQMARVRVEHEEELEPWLREEVERYLPSEWVFAAYNPHLADPVKNRAVIHDNPAGLVRTWIKMGIRFPQTYIDAFLDNSAGCWFLEDTSHSRIYGIGTESGFGYLSTDNRTMPTGCEIVEYSYLPGLRAFLEDIVSENSYQRIPVLSVIFAPAFYWWLLVICVTAACYRREYEKAAVTLFFITYYLTLLLSPAVLVRYMYPYVVTVPVLCCLMSAKPDLDGSLSG